MNRPWNTWLREQLIGMDPSQSSASTLPPGYGRKPMSPTSWKLDAITRIHPFVYLQRLQDQSCETHHWTHWEPQHQGLSQRDPVIMVKRCQTCELRIDASEEAWKTYYQPWLKNP